MTSTHSSHSVHASHNNHSNSSGSHANTGAASHSVSYGPTLRSTVPDNTTSSSDPGTLAVLTAAINDIRVSWGMSRVPVPSSYAGLQTLVSGLSKTITKYQWGGRTVSVFYGGTSVKKTNGVFEAGAHASSHASSAGGGVHGSSPSELVGSVSLTLTAPTWSTVPQTLLNNLNANKVLLGSYLPGHEWIQATISSKHGNHSSHSSG